MKNLILLPVVLLLAAGCYRTPVRPVPPFVQPPVQASESVISARAAQMKQILAPCRVRGIGINVAAVVEEIEHGKLVGLIKKLGFNRLYCLVSSEVQLNGDLKDLVCTAVRAGLPVEIVLRQRDFYRHNQANRFLRHILPQYHNVVDAAGKVAKFNRGLPEGVKLAGVTVFIEPHLYNNSHAAYAIGQLYRWSPETYGVNGDNDMLLRAAVDAVRKIKGFEEIPQVTVAVPDFYHEKGMEGGLSCGRIRDFEALTGQVVIVNSGNVPSQLHKNIEKELADASGRKNVMVAVNIAQHTSVSRDALRRRNWSDFARAVHYAVGKYSKYPSFGGIVISPLSLVEFMRLEK